MKITILLKVIFLSSLSLSLIGNAYATASWKDVKVKPEPNTVSLTFDDGPSPIYTPEILEILKQNNIKATFFVEGQFAKRYPELIKQIYADGNIIANHTMTHPMLTRLNTKTMQNEIHGVNNVVKDILGIQIKCLRPPYGKHNQAVDDYAHTINLTVLTWDLNSFDYDRPGVPKLINWVVNNTHDRYVILLHDGGGNRSQTVAALPEIIKGLRAKGYSFDTICG